MKQVLLFKIRFMRQVFAALVSIMMLTPIGAMAQVTSGDGWSASEDKTTLTISSDEGEDLYAAYITYKKQITKVILLSDVKTIKDDFFSYFSALTTIDLSQATNLTKMGNNAFLGCPKLTSITIPTSMTNIGKNAFLGSSPSEPSPLPRHQS